MKHTLIKSSLALALAGYMIVPVACTKDYSNPNAVPSNQAFSSPQAMAGVAAGLQRVYTAGRASSLYNKVSLDGLLSKQLTVLNQGNTSEYQLQLGGNNVDGTNTILGGLWTTSNKIIFDADQVIKNAETLGDKSYASGLIGYATVFKALALGDLAMFWERVPAEIGKNVGFTNRADNFTKAITAIDKAIAAIGTSAPSSAVLNTLPAGIDLINTLQALKARYSLFLGNYAQALAAANLVSGTARSVFNFNTVNLNPIFETATSTNNVYAPVDLNMGLPAALQPQAGDRRVPFYISTNATAPIYRISGFGAGNTTAWPVFLQGEIALIKAEAYTRQAAPDLNNALVELNKVITKTPAADNNGVGAGLNAIAGPLTAQQTLDEIFRQRTVELYLQGMRLEDMRRFGRPNAERNRNFLPYPFLERDNNTNTPPDPQF